MKYPLLSGMDLTIVDSPQKYIPYVWRKTKRYILQKKKPQEVEISLGDFMLCRESLSQLQFGVAALCLDIKQYLENGDASFYYQNLGKMKWYGKDYDTKEDDKNFRDIIDSIVANGYNKNSMVELDRELTLQNGTHRSAMLLCLHQYTVKGLVFSYRWHWFKDAKQYVNFMHFDKHCVDEIMKSYRIIEENLIGQGATFALCLQKDNRLEDELMKDKNIRLLKKSPTINGGVYYQFMFFKPKYRIEGNNIISRAAEKMIKKLQRKGITNYRVARNCSEGMEMYNEMIK